jgi:putative acetyltransferase
MPAIDFAGRRDWICERIDTREATGTVILCAGRGDGPPLGFAMIEPERRWLEQLAVVPDAFGCGVGTVLLEAAKRLSPDGLGLRVNQDNPRAVAFYRRAGLRIIAAGTNPGGRLPTWDMEWSPA